MFKVLLADDESTMRLALAQMVDWAELDCQVVFAAKDGVEALDYLRANPVDIAVLDIRMPGLSGLQVCGMVAQEQIPTVIVMLTAYSDFDLVRDALRLGVCDYVIKSAFEAELPAAIEKAKRAARQRRFDAQVEGEALRCDSRYAEIVNQAIAYMREHFTQRIRVSDVADSLFLNQSYLCRLYKKQTGLTMLEDLTQYRLDHARRLLSKGMTVESAARESGFESIAYFSSLFTKNVGVSPGKYRKDCL